MTQRPAFPLAHAPTDSCGSCSRGIGRPNVQCLFLSPAGKVLHVASGYVGPKDLAKEVRFAKQVYNATRKSPENAKNIVAGMHAKRLKQLGFDVAEIRFRRRGAAAQDIAERGTGSVVANGQLPGFAKHRRMAPSQIRSLMRRRNDARRRELQRWSAASRYDRKLPSTPDGDDFHLSRNTGIFASVAKRAVLSDHRFSIVKPLYPISDLLKRPRILIGNAHRVYGSAGPGGASGGTIGRGGKPRFYSRQSSAR